MLKFAIISFFALLIIFLASCATYETVDDIAPPQETPPPPLETPPPIEEVGHPRPGVYVDGRYYFAYQAVSHGFLDETFAFIGEVSSFEFLITHGTENLRTNMYIWVGSPLYHSGDDLILVHDGAYIHFRYEGPIPYP